jgi:hypothetical protein
MEVLCHFALQDGCHLEAAGRRTLVGHTTLALEEESLQVGGDTVWLVPDRNAPVLEKSTLVARTLFVRQKMSALCAARSF